MTKAYSFFITLMVFCYFSVNSQNSNNTFANTPPMGWNSYNSYGATVREAEVKENADYMAKNLKKYGWEYVVVDFCWSYPHHTKSVQDNPGQMRLPKDGSYQPWLAMDCNGRLLPDLNKFPSSVKGNGFKPLGDYIHELGLKFGIHVMRGIPRQAVWEKTPILGTNGITADMIADTTSTCSWLDNMYGLDMSKPGAQEYLNSLLSLYAGWGVDFIKVDDILSPFHGAEIEGFRKAIRNCGRPIVLSLSCGDAPVAHASQLVRDANMWRISSDFWDEWKSLKRMFSLCKTWEGIGESGAYPDCDMLQIGRISKRGPVEHERYSRFTEEEAYTHITLWCMFRSPLIMGGNLPENRELETKLMTNEEVIAVNQNGENPRELFRMDDQVVWVSKMKDKEIWNVAFFNLGDTQQTIGFKFSELGLKGKHSIRDLWQKRNIGNFNKEYKQSIPPHGTVLLQIQ